MPSGVGVQTWEGYVAHPKLASVINRSLLTATTAALIAGPLAAAGVAQTTDDLTGTLKLTCEEALKTEETKLIDEFCTAEELEALGSPLSKSVDEVTKTTESTTKTVTETVAPKSDDGGDKDGESSPAPKVLEPTDEKTNTGTEVGPAAGEKPRGFDPGESSAAASSGKSKAARKAAANRAAAAKQAPEFNYNADGPILPGMQSHSSLTLQPFAAPLVSVPPVYELPQVAQQLFGSTSDATAADPQVAGASGSTATAASPYSPTGFSATSADPTGWLAATATGLIMLVGAGHALNGGRKPGRSKA